MDFCNPPSSVPVKFSFLFFCETPKLIPPNRVKVEGMVAPPKFLPFRHFYCNTRESRLYPIFIILLEYLSTWYLILISLNGVNCSQLTPAWNLFGLNEKGAGYKSTSQITAGVTRQNFLASWNVLCHDADTLLWRFHICSPDYQGIQKVPFNLDGKII